MVTDCSEKLTGLASAKDCQSSRSARLMTARCPLRVHNRTRQTYDFVTLCCMVKDGPLKQFHPIIQQWFLERYAQPTDIQLSAWPRIAAGEHLLITAPTGSGKTLTAFLWAINQFVTGEIDTGKTRVLYISPLKALNNDIRVNLLNPLDELKSLFAQASEAFPEIRVATRSGDTDQSQRRHMQRHPPEILITTPESLNLMLSSQGGRSLLYDIDTVILDEIHNVVDSKRGVYLVTAVERLAALSGEFQRIALSATVNPLEAVADFIGGYEREGDHYRQRQVGVLASTATKHYDISIRYPLRPEQMNDGKLWDHVAADLLPKIEANQSTLIFVNSRALCEKLTFRLNQVAGRIVAWAHHGSLSREIRSDVESRLKAGRLDAIVATSSLEMGIDIGALDEVILVQSPGSIASTIQRIGRAGHQVGAASRCTLYPTHALDMLEAAVLAQSVMQRSLEPIRMVTNPLDVLGQIIISMTGAEPWDIDELYAEIRCSTPYHNLRKAEFDLVINMLLGRYADHHIRELKPRVRVDRINNRIEARQGAVLSLYLSGGVIPDRGYFQLRHEKDNARIGELDEEFVWEARVGQVFSLGTQIWQVKKITHNDVIVAPGNPGSSAPPFWKSEPLNRSFHYASAIGEFLEAANDDIHKPGFHEQLIKAHYTEPDVAAEITGFLERQLTHCDRPLPHRHHVLFETITSGPGRGGNGQLVIHTGWGARVNRPFAMAIEAAWQNRFGEQPEVFVANESLVLQLPHPVTAAEILTMVPVDELESLLRARLEGSGFFGARFRENAGRALLLSKGRFNERKPLWMSRLQSQKLMDAVLKYEDFPILLETWRTCLRDEFDIENLQLMLKEIEHGEIRITEATTGSPSPFAQSVAWDQINTYMYMSDTPKSNKRSNLREDLLREVVFSDDIRPTVTRALADQFTRTRQRLDDAFLPRDVDDLEDWIKERCVLPIAEWQALIAALPFELVQMPGVILNDHLVVSHDDEAQFSTLLDPEWADIATDESRAESLEVLLSNWLQYYGPVELEFIQQALGLPTDALRSCLDSLITSNTLISGVLITADTRHYFCDADNFEYLLRIQRNQSRPNVVAKALTALPAFVFGWQTQFRQQDCLDCLFECLDKLRGIPLPAGLWESDVLPARIKGYATSDLDLLFQEGDLMWLGVGEKMTTICFRDDPVMLIDEPPPASTLITDTHARYDFMGLLDRTAMPAADLIETLWQEVWQSQISNDSPASIRRGIQQGFKAQTQPAQSRQSRPSRGQFQRWRGQIPLAGNWYQLPDIPQDYDSLERQELEKDRARLMVNRYGIVFRELCQRESTAFSWRKIFRALRLMELSGEVVSGHFFAGISGPQYMNQASLRHFVEHNPEEIFFINAMDPASPAGLGLGIHGDDLPRRIPSTYLVYEGEKLILTLAKRGRELTFLVPPDAVKPEHLQVIDHLCYRSFEPVRSLKIEIINHEAATTSPYLNPIEQAFTLFRDHKAVVIQRDLTRQTSKIQH